MSELGTEMTTWVLVADSEFQAPISAAKHLSSHVTALVVGAEELAKKVASTEVENVLWIDATAPAEAYAAAVTQAVTSAAPELLLSGPGATDRVLLGSAAAGLEMPVVPNVVSIEHDAEDLLVKKFAAEGRASETLRASSGLAAIYVGPDLGGELSEPSPISPLSAQPSGVTLVSAEAAVAGTGLAEAEKVVSFGRGVRAKDDVALVRQLADALGAEIACSMPVADDLGWLEKERYVGRSGQQISPQLYLALGIDGAPQHMEGVRGAKVVVAVNNNPEARIFKNADYGIVGDLYEVVPALINAIDKK